LNHRAGRLLHLPRPPSHRAQPSAIAVLLHHHRDLRPSSPPLHEPQAGALHLFSGLLSPVPHRRPTSPLRAHHSEPLRCLCPKLGPSPLGLAPWHLLLQPLIADRSDSSDEPHAREEWGGGAPLFHPGPKGSSRAGRFHWLGQAPQRSSPISTLASFFYPLNYLNQFPNMFQTSEMHRKLDRFDKMIISTLLVEFKHNL
jgi:hypothetical protein